MNSRRFMPTPRRGTFHCSTLKLARWSGAEEEAGQERASLRGRHALTPERDCQVIDVGEKPLVARDRRELDAALIGRLPDDPAAALDESVRRKQQGEFTRQVARGAERELCALF